MAVPGAPGPVQGMPLVQALKLQAAFEAQFLDLEQRAHQRAQQRRAAHQKLVELIIAVEPRPNQGQTTMDQISQVYRLVFKLLLLECTDPATTPQDVNEFASGSVFAGTVDREVAAALESIFPRVGLRAFLSLTAPSKSAQLQELCGLVLGVRLYNWHLAKGGEGLPTEALADPDEAHGDLLMKVENLMSHLNRDCELLADFVLYAPHAAGDFSALAANSVHEVTYLRQCVNYLGGMQDELVASMERRRACVRHFQEEALQLDVLISGRSSVQKGLVYPRFEALSRAFLGAWEECQKVDQKARLLSLLQGTLGSYRPRLSSELERVLQQTQAKVTREQVLAGLVRDEALLEGDYDTDAPVDAPPVLLTMEDTPDFIQLQLDFQGFCLWTLALGGGLLVPGDPSLGVVRFRGQHCVFSSEVALRDFLAKPESIFGAVKQQCVAQPPLIRLLRVHEYFPKASLATMLGGHYQPPGQAVKADAGTETPVHIVESHLDPDYSWNEWDLRRRATKIADCRRKRTHAQQTVMSTFKRDSATQYYPKREQATNTTKDAASRTHRIIQGYSYAPNRL